MENTHWVFFMLLLLGSLHTLTATGSDDYETAQHRGDIDDSPSQAVGATGLGFSGIQQRHDGYVKGETPTIPKTSFTCSAQPFNPGLYADMETQCQVYHVCFEDRQESFLCGPGTNFNQKILACDFWYNFNCQESPSFYDANADIGKIPDPYRPTGEQTITTGRTKITQRPIQPNFPRDEQRPITEGDRHDRPRTPVVPPPPRVPPPQPPRIQPPSVSYPPPQPPSVSYPPPQPPSVSYPPPHPPSVSYPPPHPPSVSYPPPHPPSISYPPPHPPSVSYPPPQPPSVSYPPPHPPRVSYPPPHPPSVSYPPPPHVSEPSRIPQPPTIKVRPPPSIQQKVDTEYDFVDTKPPFRPSLPPPPPPRQDLPPPPPPRPRLTTTKPVFPPVVSPPRISRPPLTPPVIIPPTEGPRVPVRPQFPSVSDHPDAGLKGSTGYRPQQPPRVPHPSRPPIDTSYPPPRPIPRPESRPSSPPFQQEHVDIDYVPLPPPKPPSPAPRPIHQDVTDIGRIPPPIKGEYVPIPSTPPRQPLPPPPPRQPLPPPPPRHPLPPPPPRQLPVIIVQQEEYVPPPPPRPPPRQPLPPPPPRQPLPPPPPRQPPVIVQQEEYVPPPPPPLVISQKPIHPPVSPPVITVQQKPVGRPPRPPVVASGRPQQPPPPPRPRPVFPPPSDHPNANVKGGPGYQQPPPQPPRFEPTRTVTRQPPSDSSRTETSRIKTPSTSVSTGYQPPPQTIIDRVYEPPRIPPVSVPVTPPRSQIPSFPPIRPPTVDHPDVNIKGGSVYQPPVVPQRPHVQTPSSPTGIKRPDPGVSYDIPKPPSISTTGIKTVSKPPSETYQPPLPYPPVIPGGRVKVPSQPTIQQVRPQFPAPRPQPIDHPNANVKGGPGYQPPRPQQPVRVQPPSSPTTTSHRTKTPPQTDTSTGRGFQTTQKRPAYPKVDDVYPPAIQQDVYEPPRKPLPPAVPPPQRDPVSTVKQTTGIKQVHRGPPSSSHRVSVKTKQPQPDYNTGSSYKRGSETYPKPEFQQPAYQPPIVTPPRSSDLSKKRPTTQTTSHETRSQFPTYPGASIPQQTTHIRPPPGSLTPAEYPYREVPGHQPPHQRQVFPHRENPDHPNESIKGSGAYRPPPPVDFQPAGSEVVQHEVSSSEAKEESSKLGDTGTE